MSKTNCINCGAVKEVTDLQCPFCGTKYADFTTFDLMGDEPIYIQLNSNGKVQTAMAYITRRELKFEPNYMDITNVDGRRNLLRCGMNVSGEIGFTLFESL